MTCTACVEFELMQPNYLIAAAITRPFLGVVHVSANFIFCCLLFYAREWRRARRRRSVRGGLRRTVAAHADADVGGRMPCLRLQQPDPHRSVDRATARGCRPCWRPARRRRRRSAVRSRARCNGSSGGSGRSPAPRSGWRGPAAAESRATGQMDCIDISANNTSLFLVLMQLKLLHHHRPELPVSRGFLIDGRLPHTTARAQRDQGRPALGGRQLDPQIRRDAGGHAARRMAVRALTR